MAIAEKQTIFPFEETHKMAYSHGFESIYALETVDPKTIRKIESPKKVEKPQIKRTEIHFAKSEQLEFDLGCDYRGFMESFILQEPLYVLELPSHIEKALIDHGITTIKDLEQADHSDLLAVRGLGRGHFDEIRSTLSGYLSNQTLYESRSVNFASLLKGLVGTLDRKKAVQLLKDYNLDHLLNLTQTDRSQLWKVSDNQIKLWKQESVNDFQSNRNKQTFYHSMQQVVSVFLIPWMRKRLTVSTKDELVERLQRVAHDPENLEPMLNFFGDIYCDKGFPLDGFILKVDQNLYASDPYMQQKAQEVLSKSYSYFYIPEASYSLDHLISLVERECSLKWKGFSDGFVEKVLRLSSLFRVRKTYAGTLKITLS